MLQQARAASAAPLPRRLLEDNMLLCQAATNPPRAILPRATSQHLCAWGQTCWSLVSRGGKVLPAARCLRTQPVPACPRGLAEAAGGPGSASAGSSIRWYCSPTHTGIGAAEGSAGSRAGWGRESNCSD